MDNVNQNVRPETSGVSNVLSGIGIFILGILITLFFLVLASIFNFGPKEVWIKRELVITALVIIYGIVGYILGKIKPNFSWKSGFLLSLNWIPSLVVGVAFFGIVNNLGFLLPTIILLVISPLSSFLGSRSYKVR